jgi:hypothetical protein
VFSLSAVFLLVTLLNTVLFFSPIFFF